MISGKSGSWRWQRLGVGNEKGRAGEGAAGGKVRIWNELPRAVRPASGSEDFRRAPAVLSSAIGELSCRVGGSLGRKRDVPSEKWSSPGGVPWAAPTFRRAGQRRAFWSQSIPEPFSLVPRGHRKNCAKLRRQRPFLQCQRRARSSLQRQRRVPYQLGPPGPGKRQSEIRRAEVPIHRPGSPCGPGPWARLRMGRTFGPPFSSRTIPWLGGPGWYGTRLWR